MKYSKPLIYIIIISTILKIIIILSIYNSEKINYWEYGIIAQNILNGKGYSLFYYEDDQVKFEYNSNSKPYPSAYMPPAYVYYLIPFMAIENNNLRNILFLLIQIFISNIAIYLTFVLSSKYFDHTVGIISASLYAFLPEFIYSNFTPGTTLLYHILTTSLLLLIDNLSNKRNLFISSILFVILTYLRAEFIFFVIIILIYLISKKQYYSVIIISFIVITSLLPWVYRNYTIFNRVIPMTTSGGLNLYRGHNPYQPGIWADEKIADSLNKLAVHKDYEIKMNDFYFAQALNSIKENPLHGLKTTFVKLYHLWFINPNDNRSLNLLYLIPWIFMIMLFIYGMVKIPNKDNLNYIFIFLVYHSIISIIFFSLPRYQTMMKIALLPIISWSLNDISKRFKKPR